MFVKAFIKADEPGKFRIEKKFGSFAVIHASSSLQRCVSLSTPEAEIIAPRAALHFTMCLLPTVESMFTDQINVRIFVDSKAAIQISEKRLSRKLGHVRKLQQVSIRWGMMPRGGGGEDDFLVFSFFSCFV